MPTVIPLPCCLKPCIPVVCVFKLQARVSGIEDLRTGRFSIHRTPPHVRRAIILLCSNNWNCSGCARGSGVDCARGGAYMCWAARQRREHRIGSPTSCLAVELFLPPSMNHSAPRLPHTHLNLPPLFPRSTCCLCTPRQRKGRAPPAPAQCWCTTSEVGRVLGLKFGGGIWESCCDHAARSAVLLCA